MSRAPRVRSREGARARRRRPPPRSAALRARYRNPAAFIAIAAFYLLLSLRRERGRPASTWRNRELRAADAGPRQLDLEAAHTQIHPTRREHGDLPHAPRGDGPRRVRAPTRERERRVGERGARAHGARHHVRGLARRDPIPRPAVVASILQIRGTHEPDAFFRRAAGAPGRPGSRRRDLPVALSPEGHRPGGLPLRLDARRRRARRRLGQARDGRREPGAPRRVRKGASRSVSVGGRHEAHHAGFTDDRRQLWAGGLDDSAIFVFDVATRSGAAEARAHGEGLPREDGRRGRSAHLLRAPGPHADHRALERRGLRRPDRHRRVRERRRLRAHGLAAGRRRVRLRRAREPAPEPHAHLLVHRARRTTCGSSPS